MIEYGKSYVMGQMKKQGELSSAPDGVLHREGLDKNLIGPTSMGALNAHTPRQPNPDNKVDLAVFRMADEKDY